LNQYVRILGYTFGIVGLSLLIAICMLPNNVAAVDHYCADYQAEVDCSMELYGSYNLYVSQVLDNDQWVSDEEYTGWISIDKTNLKYMTEYSYSDSSPDGGYSLTAGSYAHYSKSNGHCDEWVYDWTGSFDSKTFYWYQYIYACTYDVTDVPNGPYFYWSDEITFASAPGYTQNYMTFHRDRTEVQDTTNRAWVYHLSQTDDWVQMHDELAFGNNNVKTNELNSKIKIDCGNSNDYILIYTSNANSGHTVFNLNKNPGYSDSTPYLADTNEDVDEYQQEVWQMTCMSATSSGHDVTMWTYMYIRGY
jgi:hypothetical protein